MDVQDNAKASLPKGNCPNWSVTELKHKSERLKRGGDLALFLADIVRSILRPLAFAVRKAKSGRARSA